MARFGRRKYPRRIIMAQFGGNEFTGFSVPLVFEGRYFIMEPGNPPLITVVVEVENEPVFEILKNNPEENEITETTSNPTGIVTVSEKESGKFLYKVRPDSVTSITFGKLDGDEISVKITDMNIQVGDFTIGNNLFHGTRAGVVVDRNGGVKIGPALPAQVVKWLETVT